MEFWCAPIHLHLHDLQQISARFEGFSHPLEAELEEKLQRLSVLNAELSLDKNENALVDETEEPSEEEEELSESEQEQEEETSEDFWE